MYFEDKLGIGQNAIQKSFPSVKLLETFLSENQCVPIT